MTHARIRAAQGDVEGARRVLAAILCERPDHAQARALLQALGRAGALPAARERILRLRRLLARVAPRGQGGGRHA